MSRRVAVLLLVAAVAPAALAAQGTHFTVGGVAGQEIVSSRIASVRDRFSGLVLGVEGAMVSDRLAVRVRYGEGRLNASEGTAADPREIVEGEALFGFRALPWLTLWAGPSARAYTMDDRDERWLIWSGRATARGTLLPGRMQTFVELWGAVSGSVGDPPVKAGGRGANGGLEVRLGQESAFWGRLGYRIESMHANGLRETVEALTLSMIYGLPQ
jgi:hypothetical protein